MLKFSCRLEYMQVNSFGSIMNQTNQSGGRLLINLREKRARVWSVSAKEIGLIVLVNSGGKGGGVDHVSRKIKWPFHISRTIKSAFHVSREKRKRTFLQKQFFFLWLRTIAKALPCSMSSPFACFLFWPLWKGNRVLCLDVEARHHLLLIQNHWRKGEKTGFYCGAQGDMPFPLIIIATGYESAL